MVIAMDIITNSLILFPDEPTSGLGYSIAYTVVLSLPPFAKQGRTIVTINHQPSSKIFSLFDDLLLLVEGKILHYGEAKEAVNYFNKVGYPCPDLVNPADFIFMEIIRPTELPGFSELRMESDPGLHTAIVAIEAVVEVRYPHIKEPGKRRSNYLEDS